MSLRFGLLGAIVSLGAVLGLVACDDGTSVVSGSDEQLARDALVRDTDLPRGYDSADRPDTDTPFVDPADGCEALERVADTEPVARAGSDAFVAGDTSRWLTSTVWVFPDAPAATTALESVSSLESFDCFSAFFDAAFIEATAEQNPRPFLVLDTIEATDVDLGDGGVRVEGVGRFTAGESQSSLAVAHTTVRSGRALAMLHTIVGGDPDPEGDAELLSAMLSRLTER
ncbi:MAG TPA: hypothetical protein VFZ83_06030 [Acidimicrobiia bacterium]|nr:hypothetical protein [Acidimicrobiia bacterium]